MSNATQTLSASDPGMLEFKQCLEHVRNRHPEQALLHVRRALELTPQNPFYLSYLGLLTAVVERRFVDGEKFCLEALEARRNHAQLYLNLAEVYQSAARPQEAIEVLNKGFLSTGRDSRIRRALKKFGARREPVLSFLHRGHSLNRVLGRWRHRLKGPTHEQ